MSGRFWSEREIEILERMYPHVNVKISMEELCQTLGRSRNSVRHKADDLGLARHNVYEKINEEMLAQLERRVSG